MRTVCSVAYLDSSALFKLAVEEAESPALRRAVSAWPRRASSRLSVVEVLRAAPRRGPDAMTSARRALSATSLIAIGDPVLVAAAELDPPALRALDAVHLASALRLGPDLGAFVSYDERQLEAARDLGLPAVSPC